MINDQPGQPQNLISSELILQAYSGLINIIGQEGADKPGRMDLFGWDLEYPTLNSLTSFLDYILYRRINDFLPDNDQPVILDCGANIGYTVLNYKRQFPKAQITAFEPDPDFLPYLKNNLSRNGAEDVKIIEAAAWVLDGQASWYCEGFDGSRIVENGTSSDNVISVPTVDLAGYLDRDIDLLKVDIEGAEFSVIPYLGRKLRKVKNILIECHITDQEKYSQFAKLIQVLTQQGYKLSINSYSAWRDLIRRTQPATVTHSEQYLLVCGWRTENPSVSQEASVMPYYGAPFALEQDLQRLKIRKLEEELEKFKQERNKWNEQKRQWKKERNNLAGLLSKNFIQGPVQSARLIGPFTKTGGECWTCDLSVFQTEGDTPETPDFSSLLIYEDNRLLGPAHTMHEDICNKGHGRYSHWHSALYFSTSDGTDPNTNNRIYTLIFPRSNDNNRLDNPATP
jgi:FkbM family methyltransferase